MTASRSIRRLPAGLAILALLTAACAGGGDGDPGSENDAALTVVATTTILGDLAANVVGDNGEVVILMPVGADPHDFRASAEQVASINAAELVIANGLFLEEGLEDVLDAAADDGARIFELAPLLDPIPFDFAAAHDQEDDEADEDDHGTDDPHVWLDPTRVAEGARLLAAELAAIAPEIDWSSRAEAYAAELNAVDEEISQQLAPIPAARRKLVTSHEALGYFAARYDFEVIGTVIPAGSTLADPSSEALAELIGVMEREGVTVIFAETTQPEALAEAVAAELGETAQVVDLYTGSLGEPGSGAETLIGMLQTNAARIAAALDG